MRNEQLVAGKGRSKFLIFALSFFLFSLFAQEQASGQEDLWVCPVFETGFYGVSTIAFGGGAALGYGDRVAYGFKALYWFDGETVSAWELNFLARYYFFSMTGNSGLFIQFSGGPVIFTRRETNITTPIMSLVSAGIGLGWRFLLGRHTFVEPAVRAGYPYIAGLGLSAGVRF